jgi:hypothetical protein
MLWARNDGEVMSLSMGEFSILNKPVISMKIGDLSHVHLLGNKAIWYNDSNSLTNILLNFNPEIEKKQRLERIYRLYPRKSYGNI